MMQDDSTMGGLGMHVQHKITEARRNRLPVTRPLPVMKSLPTMYDLPSEDPEEPGVPDLFHVSQPHLLSETFLPPDYAQNRILFACDLNLYYDIQNHGNYKRPDWFAALDVDKEEMRLSYVIWQEKVVPSIVVELLSPGTEDEDLGLTTAQKDRPPTKWEVYEKILGIPYYVTFSRHTGKIQAFELIGGKYVELHPVKGRLWLDKLKIGLGLWNGTWDGYEHTWLRCYDINNEWIPTSVEKTEKANLRAEKAIKKAEKEKKKLEKANLRAEKEKKKLEKANLRAEKEKKKVEKANLRAEKEKKKVEQEKKKLEKANLRAEKEKKKVEQEKKKLEKANLRAEKEKKKAEQERKKAEQANLRAEQLAAKLRELGVVV
ncbi:Uma2 family endonuclease [Desulfobacterales bacterium HSG16]|nr:Uma2 family endonuclease [Desulfobacterales bacterium HSG16]